jgi:hypothetical protein
MDSLRRMDEMEEWFGDAILDCGVLIARLYMMSGGVLGFGLRQ